MLSVAEMANFEIDDAGSDEEISSANLTKVSIESPTKLKKLQEGSGARYFPVELLT